MSRFKSLSKFSFSPFSLLLVFCLGIFISGCGAKISPELDVPIVGKVDVAAPLPASRQVEVYVQKVSDTRPTSHFVEYRDQEIVARGDIAGEVRRALERSLQAKGFLLNSLAPVTINVELRRWQATVSEQGPLSAEGVAALYVQVFDPSQHKIFSGSYQGQASVQKPSIGDVDVKSALTTAMSEALHQLMSDGAFVGVLASY